jgi:hypothetical protein
MACLEWLAMAEVDFGLTRLVSPILCKSRLSWIRHDLFSKRHKERKKRKSKFDIKWSEKCKNKKSNYVKKKLLKRCQKVVKKFP